MKIFCRKNILSAHFVLAFTHFIFAKARIFRAIFTNTFCILKIIFFLCTTNAQALAPEQHLQNPAQEQRAMKLFLEVKCLVCAGQSIESSSTEFSHQMRLAIREKIAQGETDEQVLNQLVQEFGEDVLMSATNNKTILLWILPLLFAIFVAIFLVKKVLYGKLTSRS